jgi:hypothetical protein
LKVNLTIKPRPNKISGFPNREAGILVEFQHDRINYSDLGLRDFIIPPIIRVLKALILVGKVDIPGLKKWYMIVNQDWR